MELRRVLSLAAVVSVLFIFNSQAQKKNNWSQLYEASKYKDLPYKLMKPLNFDSSKKYPLIVSLHGAGGRGDDNKKQLKAWNGQLAADNIRKGFPCYVLAPQSKGLWNGDQLNLIKEIIKTLPAVDMKRIYIIGHSMGGYGTFIFIKPDPKYLGAAVPSAVAGLTIIADFISDKRI